MIFFGAGCIRYSEREQLKPSCLEVMEDPLGSSGQLSDARHRVDQIYEHYLGLVANALNTIHNEHRGKRYWRIVLGPWLHFYLASLFDRWCWVNCATGKYPQGTTIGLSKHCFVTPSDSIHHVNLLMDDLYNLQLYSRIFDFLEVPFTNKPHIFDKAKPETAQERNLVIKFFKRVARNIINVLIYKSTSIIFVRSSYFSIWQEKELFLRSKGLISAIYKPPRQMPDLPINNVLRNRLASLLPQLTDFEGAAIEFLPDEIPKCFIEGYRFLADFSKRDFPKYPRVIFSSNSFFFDESFKLWAAMQAERGVKILSHQHGNNYGALEWLFGENHEISISDRYYTWGWDTSGSDSEKIVPFIATKLGPPKKNRHTRNDSKNTILMAITSEQRFALSLISRPSQINTYLNWLFDFICGLTEDSRGSLTVRLHEADHGWDIVQRLREVAPDLRIDTNCTVPFLKELADNGLFVCDHLGTTLLEAFAAGKPSVFFFDPSKVRLRKEAKPYYEELKDVGVLFHDPIQAAKLVNLIVDDPESWWMDPARQVAVQRFTDRFARASKDAVKLWAKELISLTRDRH